VRELLPYAYPTKYPEKHLIIYPKIHPTKMYVFFTLKLLGSIPMNIDKLNFIDLFDSLVLEDSSLSFSSLANEVTFVAEDAGLCDRDAMLFLIFKELRILNADKRKSQVAVTEE
jgi:hypothetical protein